MKSEDDEFANELHVLAELAAVFLQLAEQLAEGGGREANIDELVTLAGRCVPPTTAVAVSVMSGDQLRVVASTAPVGEAIERIRLQANEGPSLDVVESSDVIVTGRVDDDERWPSFGRQVARETSIHSIATYRLYLGGAHRGALAFYSEWPDAFDSLAIAVGAIFAAYASLVLTHRYVLEAPVPAARLRSVHAEIGVAVGILLADGQRSVESAYEQLHSVSRELKVNLHEAARRVQQHRTSATPLAGSE